MFALPRRAPRSILTTSTRFYSTPPPSTSKPSLKLVAELRKLTEVSISKAREALSASNNDVQEALKWLQNDLAVSGAKKAAKVEGRSANEGLVGVSVLSRGIGAGVGTGSNGKGEPSAGRGYGGVRAAMVELNCETDFVARNELFGKLLADISHTAAFISEPVNSPEFFNPLSLEALQDAPLLSHNGGTPQPEATVSSAIRDLIAKVGEKISLRRAVAVVQNQLSREQRDTLGLRLATYSHGSIGISTQGRISNLAVLALKSPRLSDLLLKDAFKEDLATLERALARQIVGFPTTAIRSPAGTTDEGALYEQPFMMFSEANGETVQAALRAWAVKRGLAKQESEESGVEVLEFAKWTVGESI
ncbi:hypothetical protein NLI96_g8365 [Meripilus lineatus]|uniref:Elongation factor Ts, mitochondrial n=1 Tax=Meripilus lineatus TaxID=2056292 RepID=A0AAD5UXQ4_9APHY|nr:hypothetical protein NLI96_g8365 [Physisporinus lineatus]